MFTTNIDLGQVIIATLIALVGWLLGNKISGIDKRLDIHETRIYEIWSKIKAYQD